MSSRSTGIFSLIICLLFSFNALSQSPEGIKYQAVARDGSGNVMASSSMTVRIGIYRSAGAATKVYEETQNVTTNAFGLFNLNIGQGSATFGSFGSIDWGSDEHHLKVEINTGGGYVDMGTNQLQSVPYSLFAEEAGSVGNMDIAQLTDVDVAGVSNNQVLKWDGSNWIPADDEGLTSVNTDVTLDGDGSTGNELKVAQQGASTGEVLKWNGSTWAPAIDSSGGSYNAGTGISISGNTITNTDPDQPVSVSGSGATSVSGTYPNFTISSTDTNTTYSAGTGINLSGTTFDAENTTAIWNAGQLQGNSISTTTPASNEVLKWNGSEWAPATDNSGGSYNAGTGIILSGTTFIAENTTAMWNADQLQGNSVSTATPSTDEVLKWDGSQWAAAADEDGFWNQSGNLTYTYDSVGINTTKGEAGFQVNTETAMFGDFGNGSSIMYWGGDEKQGAFRTGRFYNNLWQPDSMGEYSFGSGYSVSAQGDYASAFGRSVSADGDYSFATGYLNTVEGNGSAVFGQGNYVSGYNSLVVGYNDTAMGPSSIVTGSGSVATAGLSVAMGDNAKALYSRSYSIGNKTVSNAQGAVALGQNDSALAQGSVAMGSYSKTTGAYAIAAGDNALAAGSRSVALGDHAEAHGYGSAAMGHYAYADSYSGIALGQNVRAVGQSITAIGYYSEARGYNSHSFGNNVLSTGSRSMAFGNSTTAKSAYETVIGSYNEEYTPLDTASWNDNDRLFVIGNGSSSTNRSNAMVILKNGNLGIGDNTPDYAVDISGIAYADTFQYGSVEYITDGGSFVSAVSGGLRPVDDALDNLGSSSYRWNSVWASNGTIQTSDERDKENIADINYGLSTVMQLKPVSFDWKEARGEKAKLGFLAQDLLNVLPEVVKTTETRRTEDGQLEIVPLDRYGVYYSDIIPVLVKGMQEQQEEIEIQKKEKRELKAQLESMEQRLLQMEERMQQLERE